MNGLLNGTIIVNIIADVKNTNRNAITTIETNSIMFFIYIAQVKIPIIVAIVADTILKIKIVFTIGNSFEELPATINLTNVIGAFSLLSASIVPSGNTLVGLTLIFLCSTKITCGMISLQKFRC